MNARLDKNFILIFGIICILSTFSFSFAFSQNQDLGIIEQENIKELIQFDGLLTSSVAATLSGLALAGASFLVRAGTDDNNSIFIHRARKNFIISFLFLLACLIAIFAFDAIEILLRSNFQILVFDTVLTYGLFGFGCLYLVRAAVGIYSSFVNK